MFTFFKIGLVPTHIGGLTSLTSLHLGSNSFDGTIPSEIKEMVDLKYMNLYSNSFTGIYFIAAFSNTFVCVSLSLV